MIAAWVVEPDSRRLGLKAMAEGELHISMTHIDELIGKGSKQLTMDMVSVEDVAPYAGADAEIPLRLMPILKERLEKQTLMEVFEKIEMPLIPVLIEMEFTGIAVDVKFFKDFSKELSQRLVEIQKEVYETVGYDFNLNSTQQLSKALFETLHLTPPDSGNKTKSGQFSTAAGVLEDMKDQHVVVQLLLEYREISKLVSTYLEALPRQVNPRTGRVHTSFNQTGSVTGRLAFIRRNLQNIPTAPSWATRCGAVHRCDPGLLLLSWIIRRSNCALWRTRRTTLSMLALSRQPGYSRDHGGGDFQSSTGQVHQGTTPPFHGHQLRIDLRHERLRTDPHHRPDLGRSREFLSKHTCQISRREKLPRSSASRLPNAGMWRLCGPAALFSPTAQPPTAQVRARARARSHQRAHPRAPRRGYLEGRHDPPPG